MAVSNLERTNTRDSHTVNLFRDALRSVTGYGHARVLMQYCGCCHARYMGVGAPHTTLAVVPSRYGNRADEFAEWVSRRTATVLVDGVSRSGDMGGTVVYRMPGGKQLRCSAQSFSDMCLSQHTGSHRLLSDGGMCRHGAGDGGTCRICGEPDGYALNNTHRLRIGDRNADLRYSYLMRTLPSPIRHIDTDILLVDDNGAPRLVVEMSEDPRKSVNYLKSLSEIWGIPAIHAITRPVTDGTPLTSIQSAVTIHNHGRVVYEGSLTDAVDWCEDRV